MSTKMPSDLALRYETTRRNKKKRMAQGGYVNDSAKTEHRPEPSERDQDTKELAAQAAPKAIKDSTWTSKPTVIQAQRPSKTPLTRPKLVGSDAFAVRYRDEIEEDEHRLASMPPESPKATAKTPMAKMAEGGRINGKVPMREAEMDMDEHPAGLEEDDDQMSPAKDEYMAGHFAEGGSIGREEDMQPEDEAMDEDDADIASAIMAKRSRKDSPIPEDEMYEDGGDVHPSEMSLDNLKAGIKDLFGDKPYNTQIYKAEGGMVDLDENAEEEPNDFYSRNRAALKENYDEDIHLIDEPTDSDETGDGREMDEENDHDDDIVGAIRSKMKKRSPMTR